MPATLVTHYIANNGEALVSIYCLGNNVPLIMIKNNDPKDAYLLKKSTNPEYIKLEDWNTYLSGSVYTNVSIDGYSIQFQKSMVVNHALTTVSIKPNSGYGILIQKYAEVIKSANL